MKAAPLHLGLTGGIGSGKSTVASMLVKLGATLVDTDSIARWLTAPGGAAIPAIASTFGPEFIAADGALDRARMRELAFRDASAKTRLEQILHPQIGARAAEEAQNAATPVVVFDVPLLAESSTWRSRVARVLVVDCGESTQIERVSQRVGWSADAARSVVAQQASRSQRRAVADAVIHNDGLALSALADQVEFLWSRWVTNTQAH